VIQALAALNEAWTSTATSMQSKVRSAMATTLTLAADQATHLELRAGKHGAVDAIIMAMRAAE
jgi:hypothetical protein